MVNIKKRVFREKVFPIVVIIFTLVSTYYYIKKQILIKRQLLEKEFKKELVFPKPQTDTSCVRIGVYIKGSEKDFTKLLHSYGMGVTETVLYDFQTFRTFSEHRELNDVLDLIVFSTRGLSGVYSTGIKHKLEKFVQNGGNLLVLCQKYGYDYSVLPGFVDGYGWMEDKPQRKRWAYINREHPIFSGQDNIILNCRIDGYLTIFPPNSEILLVRPDNLMPALISYNYGLGKVIITTMFPDYSFWRGNIPEEEFVLFRDLLTWAANPHLQFQYLDSRKSIEIPVKIKNYSDSVLNIEKVKLNIYTPDKKLYTTLEIPEPRILHNGFIEYWYADSIPDIKGIWMINYTLIDSNGTVIQREKTGAIFALRNDLHIGKMKLGDIQMMVLPQYEGKQDSLSGLKLALINRSDSVFRGRILITGKRMDEIVGTIDSVIVWRNSSTNLYFTLTPQIKKREGLFFLLFSEGQDIKDPKFALCKFWFGLNTPERFKKQHRYIDLNSIQDTIIKTVKLPKGHHGIYIDECLPDRMEYTLGDTMRLKLKIHTHTDARIKVVLDSKTYFVNVSKKSDNRFEVKYPITGMKRGINGINVSLESHSKGIANEYLLISVNVPDTIPPIIEVTKLPENTHASNRLIELKARIMNPGYDPTPVYDTLYYRVASAGATRWEPLNAWRRLYMHKTTEYTVEYLLPEQANGTHIQCHLTARDSMGNVARYPPEGEINYWVLPHLDPVLKEVKLNKDATVTIIWTSLKQLLSSHGGLVNDTVFLGENKVASRFIPQFQPASLSKVFIKFACDGEEFINLKIQTVEDSFPGKVIYKHRYRVRSGKNELKIPDIDVPGEGVFVSIEGSKNVGVDFDGWGKGLNTAIFQKNAWTFDTPGEALVTVLFSYKPSKDSSRLKGLQSKVLSFEVYRRSKNEDWTKISGELYDTVYTDTSAGYGGTYSYKIKCNFSNPSYKTFSNKKDISIDNTK